jgi:hypothetical protein
MPIVIFFVLGVACTPLNSLLFFFMVGLLLHLECVTIGSLTHPAGDRPSHPILCVKFPANRRGKRGGAAWVNRSVQWRADWGTVAGACEFSETALLTMRETHLT